MDASGRHPGFSHARKIAGYNRPLYLAAAIGMLVAVVIALQPSIPPVVRGAALLGALVIGWFACASFWAFHWMFDRSELLDGRWLMEEVAPPARWVQINVGLEETTIPLQEIFPDAAGRMLDIYDAEAMTEPAITRARSRTGDAPAPLRASELPVESGWADLVVVMLAAHEIRDAHSREEFFHELARIVSPRGIVVLVEHLRDLSAAIAFGPGALHFLPRREWLRLAKLVEMEVVRERPITPFVRVFVLRHRDAASRGVTRRPSTR